MGIIEYLILDGTEWFLYGVLIACAIFVLSNLYLLFKYYWDKWKGKK